MHLDDLDPLDFWMLSRLHKLVSDVTGHFARYEFEAAVRVMKLFCEGALSRGYFAMLKDRLYCAAFDSRARRSSQTVLHSILTALVKLLAPILPYTCEEVWTFVPGHSDCASVHLSKWPHSDETVRDSDRARKVTAAATVVVKLAAGIRLPARAIAREACHRSRRRSARAPLRGRTGSFL